MPNYSVATTKDKLSSLIDKALAGEEVVITRHGKPTVELSVVREIRPDPVAVSAAHEWLKKRRIARPKISISSTELLRLEREDSLY